MNKALFEKSDHSFTKKTLLLLTCLSVATIFYDYLNSTFHLPRLFTYPLAITTSIITLFFPLRLANSKMPIWIMSLLIYVMSITLTFSLMSLHYLYRNYSEVLLAAGRYKSDEGICIYFRENKTYKARLSNMLNSQIKYGKYEMDKSQIILKTPLSLYHAKLKDTLVVLNDEIHFKYIGTYRSPDVMKIIDSDHNCVW